MRTDQAIANAQKMLDAQSQHRVFIKTAREFNIEE